MPSLYFTKIAEKINIAPLLTELVMGDHLWLTNTSRQRNVRCQRETQNIFLRAAKKDPAAKAKNANDIHESCETAMAEYFSKTLAICDNIARSQNGKLGRAILVALMPKGKVWPHVDTGDYYRIRDRYHLVLQSLKGSPLTVGDETVVMREGELWTFDNKTEHSADNLSSDERRVHLIFDILPQPRKGYYARQA